MTAYDLTKNSIAATFNTGPPSQAVVSPDGSTTYVALSDGHLTVLDTAMNTNTIALKESADAIALTPNGATAYVASSFGNSVLVINTATKTQITEIPVGTFPDGIAISADGSTAYVSCPKVWHSVRTDGDTKTRKSRRTLALPVRCVDALKRHGEFQNLMRARYDLPWTDDDLVFSTKTGAKLDAAHVRRDFRKVLDRAGLDPDEWTPGSFGTASCRCSQTTGCGLRTSRFWSVTAERP